MNPKSQELVSPRTSIRPRVLLILCSIEVPSSIVLIAYHMRGGVSRGKEDSEVLDVLAIASKLEAATLTVPRGPSFGHGILLSFRAFDLDGSYVLGVVRIPILSGLVAPAEKLLNVGNRSFGRHFYLSTTGPCISLTGRRRKPNAGRPRHNITIIRSSFHWKSAPKRWCS